LGKPNPKFLALIGEIESELYYKYNFLEVFASLSTESGKESMEKVLSH
jgi:hypothetical protein